MGMTSKATSAWPCSDLHNDHKFVIWAWLLQSFKELMDQWGEFCFVSLCLYGTAVGDFGMRRPDKAAWGCFAVTEHCHGDPDIIGPESRSWGPPSQGHLLCSAQLQQRIQYQRKGVLDVNGMHCEHRAKFAVNSVIYRLFQPLHQGLLCFRGAAFLPQFLPH